MSSSPAGCCNLLTVIYIQLFGDYILTVLLLLITAESSWIACDFPAPYSAINVLEIHFFLEIFSQYETSEICLIWFIANISCKCTKHKN